MLLSLIAGNAQTFNVDVSIEGAFWPLAGKVVRETATEHIEFFSVRTMGPLLN
jgi:hypothetical protein